MGLSNNNEGGQSKFITIVGGKWTLRVQDGSEGAQSRELTKGPNAGTLVWERYYNTLSGVIKSGLVRQGQYGSDVCLIIEDEGVEYNVQMPMPSDYFRSFAKASPNIDLSQELVLGLGEDKEKGHPFLFLKQGSDTVKSAFTKAEPNGMPPWEKKDVMGKVTWDMQAQDNFLYDQLITFFGKVEDMALADIDM